jgi:hypothetical protein
MSHKIENAVEWAFVPALLSASIFSYFAASYAPLVNATLCLAGVLLAGRALRWKEYFLAAGFIAIAVASSPLPLVSKLFLLMGLACAGSSATIYAAFRPQPLPAA